MQLQPKTFPSPGRGSKLAPFWAKASCLRLKWNICDMQGGRNRTGGGGSVRDGTATDWSWAPHTLTTLLSALWGLGATKLWAVQPKPTPPPTLSQGAVRWPSTLSYCVCPTSHAAASPSWEGAGWQRFRKHIRVGWGKVIMCLIYGLDIHIWAKKRLRLWCSWERNVRIEFGLEGVSSSVRALLGKGEGRCWQDICSNIDHSIYNSSSCQHGETLLHIDCIYSPKFREITQWLRGNVICWMVCVRIYRVAGGKWGLQAGQSLKVDLCICQILYPRLLCPRPACNSNKKWASESESYYLQEFTVYNQMYRSMRGVGNAQRTVWEDLRDAGPGWHVNSPCKILLWGRNEFTQGLHNVT